MKCKHCNFDLKIKFVDLDFSPPSNSLLEEKDLNKFEINYPLKAYLCENCWLVQLIDFTKKEVLFKEDYPYFSSTSMSWLLHAKQYSKKIINLLNLSEKKLVMEIGSNDGYLLQFFTELNIPSIGIEPTKSTNEIGQKYGYKIIEKFFSKKLAEKLTKKKLSPDLIICNNVFAHVPDINDFTNGLSILLKDNGVVTLEFPHLLNLIKYNQFDTIYHEHFFYYSLTSVVEILKKFDFLVFNVEKISTHGGSLRLFVMKKNNKKFKINKKVNYVLKQEENFGIKKTKIYTGFQKKAEIIKFEFLNFLLKAKEQKQIVIGYGAAAKGNTLLNYCGIKKDLIKFVVDKSLSKQNKFLPGSHIPIYEEKIIKKIKPEFIVIFPWNIKDEIMKQLSYVKKWKTKFVVFIPKLKIYS